MIMSSVEDPLLFGEGHIDPKAVLLPVQLFESWIRMPEEAANPAASTGDFSCIHYVKRTWNLSLTSIS